MTHADIRKEFTVAGRKYEAISFVDAGKSVSGDEMIRRTDAENGGGLGQEDGDFLWEHRAEWSKELKFHNLAFTKWCNNHGDPRYVRYFYCDCGSWDQGWSGLGDQWGGRDLVVRRIA